MCVRRNIYQTSNSHDRYRVCLQIKSLKLSVVVRAAATWKGCLNKWNKCLFQTETWGTPRKLSFHNLKGHTGHLKNPVKGAFGIGAFVRLTSKAMPEDRISFCVFAHVGGGLLFVVLKVIQRRLCCFLFCFFLHRPLTCCNIRPIFNSTVIKIEIFHQNGKIKIAGLIYSHICK